MITVYSKNDCSQCDMTYKILDKMKLRYHVIKVDEDGNEHALQAVRELGYMSVPVVVPSFDKEIYDSEGERVAHWAGFRPDYLTQL